MFVLQIACDGKACTEAITYTFRPVAIRGAKDPGRSYSNLAAHAESKGWQTTADKHLCPKCCKKPCA